MQIVLAVVTLLVIGVVLALMYLKRRGSDEEVERMNRLSLDGLLLTVKAGLVELVREDDTIRAEDIEFEQVLELKRAANEALRMCKYGDENARRTVIALIKDIITEPVENDELANQVIDFDNLIDLPYNYKWEILIYRLEKTRGLKLIKYLEKEYHLTEKRVVDDGISTFPKRIFDGLLLDKIFEKEVLPTPLTFNEKLDIISILLYERHSGFGCIDTTRRLQIDGFNFGTSGSIRYAIDGNYTAPYKVTNSLWVQIDAKWVYFSFLDFGSEGEMMRIITQLGAWGVSAPMVQNKPTKVTEDIQGSRVTTIRPPAGECWAAFVRKFSVELKSMDALLDKGEDTKDWQIVKRLIGYLTRSERTLPFTGQQNTGKTTMLKSNIENVHCVNMRILEMAFELALRELYPDKNILTVKPTDYISSSNLQDFLKKTDGYLSMVGEVAEDIVAARMIQFCLVASAFTMFSHHGKDDPGLINGLTNSLVASGEYAEHAVAMSTVLDAIKHNIHLDFINDIRVIAYISEIVKLDEISPYPEVEELMNRAARALRDSNADALAQAWVAYIELSREYYTRVTDRVRFKSRVILEYDKVERRYVPKQWYTKETEEAMLKRLPLEEREEFLAFRDKYWGEAIAKERKEEAKKNSKVKSKNKTKPKMAGGAS